MADAGGEDAVELKSVSIEPNDCPLGERVCIKMTFKPNRAVNKAVWDMKVREKPGTVGGNVRMENGVRTQARTEDEEAQEGVE